MKDVEEHIERKTANPLIPLFLFSIDICYSERKLCKVDIVTQFVLLLKVPFTYSKAFLFFKILALHRARITM